jgi:protein TonB
MSLVIPLRHEHSAARQAGLWAGAAVVVVAAHVGIAASLMAFQREPENGGAPDTAIMVELAPMTTSIDAEQLETPADVEAERTPEVEPEPEPVEEDPDMVEPLDPPPLEPLPEPVIELPEPEVVTPKPDVVLPVAKPKPPEPKREKPEPKPEKKVVERKQPVKKPRSDVNSARSAVEALRADRSAAAEASRSAARTTSPATWYSRVAAHLSRYKPRGVGRGTARLRLVVDSQGNITSYSATSGNVILDRAVTDMARRAGRVPAPPADLAVASQTFTVPIIFR